MKRMKLQFDEREKQLKQKYAFRIDALEMALNELKTRSQRQIDQTQMEINEMQSFQMNLSFHGKFKETKEFLRSELQQYAERGIVVDTAAERVKQLLARSLSLGLQTKSN